MNVVWSEFKAEIAVGLEGSVALMSIEEKQITHDGEPVKNGIDFAVRNDAAMESIYDWFYHVSPDAKLEVGTYVMAGRARFDEDSSDYYGVEICKASE